MVGGKRPQISSTSPQRGPTSTRSDLVGRLDEGDSYLFIPKFKFNNRGKSDLFQLDTPPT